MSSSSFEKFSVSRVLRASVSVPLFHPRHSCQPGDVCVHDFGPGSCTTYYTCVLDICAHVTLTHSTYLRFSARSASRANQRLGLLFPSRQCQQEEGVSGRHYELATRIKRVAFSKNAGLLRGERRSHHLDARGVGVDDGVFRTGSRQHSSALPLGGEGRREMGRQELPVGLFLAQTCHIWLIFSRARRWRVEVVQGGGDLRLLSV